MSTSGLRSFSLVKIRESSLLCTIRDIRLKEFSEPHLLCIDELTPCEVQFRREDAGLRMETNVQ